MADVRAKERLHGHFTNYQEYEDAEDRAVLAILAQSSILEVWKIDFETDTEIQAVEAEDGPTWTELLETKNDQARTNTPRENTNK